MSTISRTYHHQRLSDLRADYINTRGIILIDDLADVGAMVTPNEYLHIDVKGNDVTINKIKSTPPSKNYKKTLEIISSDRVVFIPSVHHISIDFINLVVNDTNCGNDVIIYWKNKKLYVAFN